MKDQIQQIRFTKEELNGIKIKARSEGKNVSEYIRERAYAIPLILERLDSLLQEVRKNATANC